MSETYEAYTVPVPTDPSYYGSDCSQDDADRISEAVGELIQSEFPGIEIKEFHAIGESSAVTGPDENVCEQIRYWVERNWTSAI